MEYIKKINALLNNSDEWAASSLAYIKEIIWQEGNLSIVFLSQKKQGALRWPDLSKEFIEVKLKFEVVSSLKLEFDNTSFQQLSGFDIMDISSRGMEGVNFHVENYENGNISFYCKNVEVLSIGQRGVYCNG